MLYQAIHAEHMLWLIPLQHHSTPLLPAMGYSILQVYTPMDDLGVFTPSQDTINTSLPPPGQLLTHSCTPLDTYVIIYTPPGQLA